MPHHLNGASVASGIHQLIKFKPAETNFNLDGAEITANLIYHLSLSEDVGSALPRVLIMSNWRCYPDTYDASMRLPLGTISFMQVIQRMRSSIFAPAW